MFEVEDAGHRTWTVGKDLEGHEARFQYSPDCNHTIR